MTALRRNCTASAPGKIDHRHMEDRELSPEEERRVAAYSKRLDDLVAVIDSDEWNVPEQHRAAYEESVRANDEKFYNDRAKHNDNLLRHSQRELDEVRRKMSNSVSDAPEETQAQPDGDSIT